MSAKKLSMILLTIGLASVAIMMAMTSKAGPGHGHDAKPKADGLSIANAYIAGMEAGDLDALSELFIADEKSTILENASNEGSWEFYSDHHLKPELEVVKDFKFEIAEQSQRTFGDTILVEQTGTFSVNVQDETHNYRVAVSYLLVTEKGQLKIAHLHWSSRPQS